MATRIVIENDVARLEDTTIVGEVPLVDLVPHLETRLATVFPILPQNTRTIGFNPQTSRGALLVQVPPRRATIKAHLQYSNNQTDQNLPVEDDGYTLLQLAFPYMIFAFEFSLGLADEYRGLSDFRLDNWRLLWRNAPITSMDDPLWNARIMNVGEDGGICWGGTRASTDSLHERIDEMVKSFNTTIFNGDLTFRKPNRYRSYSSWQRASLESPLCWTDWSDWQADPHWTVQRLMNQVLNGVPAAQTANVRDLIPPPPNVFSIGRAMQWMRDLDSASQRRFIVALNRYMADFDFSSVTEEDEDTQPEAEARPLENANA